LDELHEVAGRILEYDGASSRSADNRLTAARHDASAQLPELGARRVEVADDRDERRRTDIVEPPVDRLAVRARDFDDLDTARRGRRACDLPTQCRVR
jgi:hypothetical protein